MAISTAMAVSFKTELLQATHNFNAPVFPTCSAVSGSTSVTALSSSAGIVVGSAVTGTSIPGAGTTTVVATPSATQLTLSAATTGAISGGAITVSGDVFKIALIKAGMSGTYGSTTALYSTVTGASDELAAAGGYSTGGVTLTNVSPANDSSSIAYTGFSPSPSWSSATFSTAGCIIYNSSVRSGGQAGRAISVHDFGGNQIVSSGTLSVLLPGTNPSTALIRLT